MKPSQKMPPAYLALIDRLAKLTVEWCELEPRLPDLRWLDPGGDTVFIGGLQGKALDFLCDSADARRLCAWLDEKTNHQATVYQMTWALRLLGHLPGGPEREQVGAASPGLRNIEAFAFKTGTDTRHETAHPCPHCGKGLDGSSGEKGATPSPGDLSVCVYCCGLMRYGEGLALVAFSEADVEALAVEQPETAAKLLEMRDLLRASRMKLKRGVQA